MEGGCGDDPETYLGRSFIAPEDAAFYDLDAQNKFVKVRSDVISRVMGEHVLEVSDGRDKAIFDAVWERQLHNPKAFWAAYPLKPVSRRMIPRLCGRSRGTRGAELRRR